MGGATRPAMRRPRRRCRGRRGSTSFRAPARRNPSCGSATSAVARNTPDYHALVAAEHGARRAVRQPHQPEPARGQGVHLRRAHVVRFPAAAGPVRAAASACRRPRPARAIEESLDEIAAIRGPRPVTPEELALGVAALTRGYARNFETAEQVARAVTQIALYDLPDDYFAQFVPADGRRSPSDEVTRVAARHLDPARLTTLIVGDLDTIAADLAELNLGEPVILSAETF